MVADAKEAAGLKDGEELNVSSESSYDDHIDNMEAEEFNFNPD